MQDPIGSPDLIAALFFYRWFAVLLFVFVLVDVVLRVLSYFRRTPSVDSMMAALSTELTRALHDFRLQVSRDFATKAELAAVEGRTGRNADGIHRALVDLRKTVQESSTDIQRTVGRLETAAAHCQSCQNFRAAGVS